MNSDQITVTTATSRESAALTPILRQISVPRDGVLVVHSAFSRLSRQGFRAEATIESLLNYLADGTLIMPTMTWRSVTVANPNWDERETPSHTGVLGEIFRTTQDSERSIHPTHSVAAVGKSARELLATHHLDETPVSPRSPYGLMRDRDAFILMIGVGLESCTAIHLCEEEIAPEIYLRPSSDAETYQCRDRHGRIHSVRTRRHWRLDRDFPKFGALLTAKGLLQAGDINGCPYQIVSLKHLLHEVTTALLGDKGAILRSD